jgi:predicted acetyltransferase
MELQEPRIEFKDTFIEAVKEYQADTDNSFRNRWYKKLSIDELEKNFPAFVKKEIAASRGEDLPEGYVPHSTYWLMDSGRFAGQVNIRHRLTPELERAGGHIGYDIRPSQRGRGLGNQILALALPKAKELGIERVLMLADTRNAASLKVIENNGGVFYDVIPNQTGDGEYKRYWIVL